MFVQKYKPKNLKEYVGQKEAVQKFLHWIENWKTGKAFLFFGSAGVGKTALVEAYAIENKLDLIEMNASDYRSAKQIREVVGQSVRQQSLVKRGKIFLIDEIDGLTEEDRGGANEIIKMISETKFPIVLTANDAYSNRLRSLRQYCILVQFKPLMVPDIEKRLSHIVEKEKLKIRKEILQNISKHVNGDMRAAINDLETVSYVEKISPEILNELGNREQLTNIFEVLKVIFKTKSALAAKLSIQNSDKDPEEIFWWIENNVANEYETPEEIANAYNTLSKADLFRQKIRSRQNWKFLAYFIDLMTGGVATAKKEMYKKFTRYQYPSNIAILSGTKFHRIEEKEKLTRLSKTLHCSTKKIRQDVLPFLKIYGQDIV